ncbi:Esterase/lipase/thioesterase [Fulvimarina pelagi HTCC2506]|uniref:Esterase/lipase/thioesterase n=2 Tax=Fulvimarina pelagi TaxID=217511 RepID=Q0G314_9HYPH|nr:alpha/beta hydrolase [Fulvimarina pelagi]EAU42017.1 Esterase/lipase/thioesterase [Fulvimarina pelagi HTCC2506]BAT30991.1 esterase/lipase/thioesterase [Fulvimarina pelagi]
MLSDQSKAVLADLARKAGVQIAPRDDAQKLEQARALTGAMVDYSGSAPDGILSEEIAVDGPAGDIRVRLYKPAMAERTKLLIWYHGGGAMAGSLESHDTALRQLSAATSRTIASVDYRLAPEHVSPAPQNDCIAATRALMAKAGELGCDREEITIGGDSIGGMFAALVAIALRDAGDAMPEAMVMLYPNTDLRPDRDLRSLHTEAGHVMTKESLLYENSLFVPNAADRTSPTVSPLLADDLTALPRTLLVTCEHDPLRDEGEAFADRLREGGVVVEHHRLDGTIHGIFQMAGWIDEGSAIQKTIGQFLASVERPGR